MVSSVDFSPKAHTRQDDMMPTCKTHIGKVCSRCAEHAVTSNQGFSFILLPKELIQDSVWDRHPINGKILYCAALREASSAVAHLL